MLRTLEEWEGNPFIHPLWLAFALIGLNLFSICLDIMHVVDKGVAAYFLASAIWTLVHDSELPGNFDQRTLHIWDMIVAAHDELRTPSSQRLPKEEFYAAFSKQRGPNPSSFPELNCKAAHIRHLVPALTKVYVTSVNGCGM